MMPAYSTTAIFIRDLKFDFGESHLDADAMRKHTSAGGFFSYGGFSLGGRYGADSAKQDVKFSENGQSIEVDGMQLIGFKCHTLKLSPNPKPSIKNWI